MTTWSRLCHTLRILHRRQKGQVIVLAAAGMVMLLGFSALAVDFGFFAHTKRDLQNSADAMALAGAQDIPDTAEAAGKAREWGTNNGVDLADELVSIQFDVTCSGNEQLHVITVRLQREQPTYLARVLGITEGTIQVCATAGRFSVGGGSGTVPWALEHDCFIQPAFGETYTLKYDADATSGDCDASRGNFAAVSIDDTGVGPNCTSVPGDDDERKYRRAICFGAIRDLCTEAGAATGDCVGEAGDDCASAPVFSYELCTETGNMTGPTRDGVRYRIDHTDANCDTWSEVTLPTGGLNPECNPWVPGGSSYDSYRVVMIPIVDGLWDSGGTHKVTIVDFAVFFLEEPPQCTGNTCDITGRFIEMALSGVPRADLDPDSALTTVALVE